MCPGCARVTQNPPGTRLSSPLPAGTGLRYIRTEDFYKEMRTNEYDLSGYPEGSDFYSTKNKKVLGKFKDECNGAAPAEFVGLRPKMYSLKIPEQKDKKTAKGVQDSAQKKITHVDYRRCLLSEETADKQQHVKQCAIRSYRHKVKSMTSDRASLTSWRLLARCWAARSLLARSLAAAIFCPIKLRSVVHEIPGAVSWQREARVGSMR